MIPCGFSPPPLSPFNPFFRVSMPSTPLFLNLLSFFLCFIRRRSCSNLLLPLHLARLMPVVPFFFFSFSFRASPPSLLFSAALSLALVFFSPCERRDWGSNFSFFACIEFLERVSNIVLLFPRWTPLHCSMRALPYILV